MLRSAPMQKVKVKYERGARLFARLLVGRGFTDAELAAAVGALPGAVVQVSKNSKRNELRVKIEHPHIEDQERWLRRDAQGELIIFNYRFFKKRDAPTGIGLESFLIQVQGAKKLGVKRIETFAAGDHNTLSLGREVGYLVWAKFGFDALLTDNERQGLNRDPALAGVRTLNELIKRPGGAEWWKLHGSDKHLVFELDDSSSMLGVFRDYLRKKGRQMI